MMNAVLKLVFLLGTLGLSASTKSFENCCQSFLDELKLKSDSAKVLCSPNNQIYVHLTKNYCKTLATELIERWDGYHKLCAAVRNRQCLIAKSMIIEQASTVDHALSVGAPQMKEVTMCFWVNTTQVTGHAHYISYARPGAYNQIYVSGQANLRIVICYDLFCSGNLHSSPHSITVNDGHWHHICITWKSKDGRYSFYKDGMNVGNGTLTYTVGKPIPGQGTWVLGQDQDYVGGGFQASQSATGEFTGVNIWDRVLSYFEIVKMSRNCKAGGLAGNVKSWADFIPGIKGNAKIGKATCCH